MVENANARALRRSPGLLRDVVSRVRGGDVELHQTDSTADLELVMRRICEGPESSVVLVGGDGTHMACVSALARTCAGKPLPPVALVAAGTVGTVARNWGGTPFSRRHLLSLFDALFRGHAVPMIRPTLRVEDDRGGCRVGFIFGTGLVTNFFQLYDASPARGELAAFKIVARGFASSLVGGALAEQLLCPVRATVRVSGEPQAGGAWSLLVASVVPNLGLGMRVTYRAAEELHRFHVVGSGLSASRLGPQLPRVLAGLPLRGGGNVSTLTERLEVSFEEPGGYILDGDSFHAADVTVSAGPPLTVLSVPSS